jgi:hypothetical protein
MTDLNRRDRFRRGGRRPGWLLLTVLLILAIAASSALVFTERVELLKLAVILSLWAAAVAAFVSVIYRRQSDIDRARARDLKLVYDLQLDREISARREYELEVESQLRRELAVELRALASDEVAELRAELAALRNNLEIMFDADLSHRPAIEPERTTVRAYSDWQRGADTTDMGGRPPRFVASAPRTPRQDADDGSETAIIDVPEEPALPGEPAIGDLYTHRYPAADATWLPPESEQPRAGRHVRPAVGEGQDPSVGEGWVAPRAGWVRSNGAVPDEPAPHAGGTPAYAAGIPPQAGDAPTDVGGVPAYAADAPTDVGGVPAYAADAPTDVGGVPAYAADAPPQAGGAPTPQAGGIPTPQAGGAPTPQAGGIPTPQAGPGRHSNLVEPTGPAWHPQGFPDVADTERSPPVESPPVESPPVEEPRVEEPEGPVEEPEGPVEKPAAHHGEGQGTSVAELMARLQAGTGTSGGRRRRRDD